MADVGRLAQDVGVPMRRDGNQSEGKGGIDCRKQSRDETPAPVLLVPTTIGGQVSGASKLAARSHAVVRPKPTPRLQ